MDRGALESSTVKTLKERSKAVSLAKRSSERPNNDVLQCVLRFF